MRTHRSVALILLLLLAGSQVGHGIELGDPAPPLAISQWVKGEARTLAGGKGKNVYVVEFWATWCPPCRASIPHLTELQERWADKGVVIIGISDEEAEKVKPFVEKMGDKMAYTVALDKNRETGSAYMKPFGVRGIPHAFVVDRKGALVWHGHPMAGLDTVLGQVVAGTYDIGEARKIAQLERRAEEFLALAAAGEETEKADELARTILREGGENANLLNDFAWQLLTRMDLAYFNADLALQAARAAYEASGGKDAGIADTYARAFYEAGHLEDAIAIQRKAVELDDTQPRLRQILEAYLARSEQAARGAGRVSWEPAPPARGRQVRITYDPKTSPMADASTLFIHAGFNRWQTEPIHENMVRQEDGTWRVVLTVPDDARQVDFVFADGPPDQRSTRWDSDYGLAWHVGVE